MAKRDQWNSDTEFLQVYLGICIGYGVIWRFPYVMFTNGGGANQVEICRHPFLLESPLEKLNNT